ncbi:MAG: DUF1427 family protein [Pseudomonadota bacterium]
MNLTVDRKTVLGLLLAFGIGVLCRAVSIPLPAPPVLIGALLVLAMTLGYVLTDRYLRSRPAKMADACGGPSGETISGSKETAQ